MARRSLLPRSPVLRWLLLLVLAFVAKEAAARPLQGVVVGPGLQGADLLDMAVAVPLFSVLFYGLYRSLKPAGPLPLALKGLALLSFALFFLGYGVNAAANDVHNAMDRFLGYGYGVLGYGGHPHEGPDPVPAYGLVYFYDEILGHKLLYAGLAGLFAAGLWLQFLRPQRLDPGEERLPWLLAPLLGAGFGLMLLEGQAAVEGLVVAPAALLALWEGKRRSHEPWSRLPLAATVAGALLWMLLLLLAWRWLFGGFVEPSDLRL